MSDPVDPNQEEWKKAAKKAMDLLLRQDRTKKELQDRLYRAGFSERAIEYAIHYVTDFGYLDDLRYAENYIHYHKTNRSKKELQYKLAGKGVEKDILSLAFAGYEVEDEQRAVAHLLEKRLRGRAISVMDYAERSKITGYLARKGFSMTAIRYVMREWEQKESN